MRRAPITEDGHEDDGETMRRREEGTMWRTMIIAGLALAGSSLWAAPAGAQGVSGGGNELGVASPRTWTIDEVVRAAVAQNPQLAAAFHTLEEAEERVSEAWGNVFPTIDLTSSYSRNLSPALNFLPAVIFDPNADPDELIPVRFGADNSWQLSIDAEQPLFNAAAFIGVGAAGRFEALESESVRSEAQSVVTRVRTAYYQLLLSQEQVRLLENSVRRVEESLEETRALNRAGLASDYDVLRLEVELANLVPDLRRARNAVQQGRRGLAVELGLDEIETGSLRVAGSLATMDLADPGANSAENLEILDFSGVEPSTPVERLLVLAMGERSDVRQLTLTQDLRKTEMRLEQVQYLPRIALFGSYGISAQENGSPDFFEGPRAYSRVAGVRVTLPVFQGFQRDARIDQKRALLRRAETETKYARNRAGNEIRTLVERLDEARERATAQELAVTQATRGYEIASAQYREGLGSQLELTDAEVALRESEFNYAEAVYDYLVARAELDLAVGRVPYTDGETLTGAGVTPEIDRGGA